MKNYVLAVAVAVVAVVVLVAVTAAGNAASARAAAAEEVFQEPPAAADEAEDRRLRAAVAAVENEVGLRLAAARKGRLPKADREGRMAALVELRRTFGPAAAARAAAAYEAIDRAEEAVATLPRTEAGWEAVRLMDEAEWADALGAPLPPEWRAEVWRLPTDGPPPDEELVEGVRREAGPAPGEPRVK
jgi:hypothetical protein